MEQIISKQEFDELMSIKGEVSSFSFKTAAEFIVKEAGEEGLNKLESIMVELGYPIKYREGKRNRFYPIGTVAVRLLFLKRFSSFDEEKFREMGRFEAKSSFVIRVFLRYFSSIERAAKGASTMWGRYFTIGNIKTAELDEEKRYVILKLENFRLHPLHCCTLMGYFSSIVQMVTGSEQVFCKERKCVHRGDEYHEFLLKW